MKNSARYALRRSRPVAIALFLACSAALCAQTSGAAVARNRVVVVYDFAPLGGDGSLKALGVTVADSLSIELEAVGFRIVSTTKVRETVAKRKIKVDVSLDLPSALAIGKTLGADIVILGFLAIEDERLVVGARAYEVASGRLAVASIQPGKGGLDVFDTIDSASVRMAVRVREQLSVPPKTETVVVVEKITTETKIVETGTELGVPVPIAVATPYEGSRIYFGSSVPADGSTEAETQLLNPEGEKNLMVTGKVGVPLTLTMRVADYLDKTFYVVPEAEGNVLDLTDAYRTTHWDLGVSYVPHFLEGAQAHARIFLEPGWWWVGATVGAGFVPNEWPMTDFFRQYASLKWSFDLGSYAFLPPDSEWRFGLAFTIMTQAFALPSGYFFDTMPGVKLRFEWNLPESAVFLQFALSDVNIAIARNNGLETFASYVEAGYLWKF